MTELHVDGWAQEPHYDRANHRLIWALNVHTADDPQTIINYSIIALGREGIISITLADSNNNLEKNKQSANQLLNTISFNQGNRYEDYSSATDKTAEYGLTALIVGATAAKKFGLIALIITFVAKFSKTIIVAAYIGSKSLSLRIRLCRERTQNGAIFNFCVRKWCAKEHPMIVRGESESLK